MARWLIGFIRRPGLTSAAAAAVLDRPTKNSAVARGRLAGFRRIGSRRSLPASSSCTWRLVAVAAGQPLVT
jgi:hypothetical protein